MGYLFRFHRQATSIDNTIFILINTYSEKNMIANIDDVFFLLMHM